MGEKKFRMESQRQQLRQASQWEDQAQRERIRLCGELELRNRRSRQEIEELRRRCNILEYQIPEMHLGKFPDRTEFQSWKVNFRTEVCPKAKDPRLAMQWIKEIEIQRQLTISSQHDRFWDEPISQIMMSWMLLWRLH